MSITLRTTFLGEGAPMLVTTNKYIKPENLARSCTYCCVKLELALEHGVV